MHFARRLARHTALTVLALAGAACGGSERTPASDFGTANAAAAPRPDSAEVRQALDSLWRVFVARNLAADAAGLVALYTDSAVWAVGGAPPIRGRAALRASFDREFKTYRYSAYQVNTDETAVDGDRAYQFGTYGATYTPVGGKPTTERGLFAAALQRDAGAGWRIARVIAVADSSSAAK
jgi:uncharacterized protein (TIGR02246 family)